MRKIIPIAFIALFILQVSVKSLVALYVKVVIPGYARENCIYKTITVCQGNCYIVKKIKIFSSESTQKNTHTPAFDISLLKDITAWPHCIPPYHIQPAPTHISVYGVLVNHYSFKTTRTLIKPPIA